MATEKLDRSSEQPSVDQEDKVAAVSAPKQSLLRRAIGTIWTTPDEKPPNMWKIFVGINNKQRLAFTAAFLGWTFDAYDFFCVSLAVTSIAKDFDVQPSDVTSAITTTLMLRPIGALLFGLAADRWGRRWPLMIDIILFSVINMASGFAPNLQTFIGLRAVFGIAMGGEWGLGASLALESLPIEARGLFSGIYQEGYALGYLLATLINYAVEATGSSWRILFWVGAAFALVAVFIRIFVPESPTFEKTQEARTVMGRSYFMDLWIMLKNHYLRTIYMIILMAFFCFLAHGTQDLYPTFLKTQLGYSAEEQTVTSVVYNIGAIIGGIIIGFYSSYIGRKLSIVVSVFLVGAFIPLWTYAPTIHSLRFGAFVLQFFVQGAFGVVPAHLNELSPPAFRALMPGLSYQLGNLISAASSQIQAKIGESIPLKNADGSLQLREGKPIADYGRVQAIFTGVVVACLLIATLVGKEERNKDFMQNVSEDAHGAALGSNDLDDLRQEQGTSGHQKQEESDVKEATHIERVPTNEAEK
ncbi:major facilitator superfamily domain-containing protein [Fennellomyces sp. T-0311]|nr:major facilitator superfamily domain-containing protein [Fennellomyces sp. T-0311]